ncbi:MAG: phosphoethanolamine transferase [Muribaculaceae bacterium]|nr:phosphoethanolamine transferase [Muribaculaceae bacterium]
MENLNTSLDKNLVRLWLVLAILASGSLADVADFSAHHEGGVPAVVGLACVSFLKSTILTAIYAFCCRNVWLRTGAILLIAAFMLLSLLNGGCWLFYGFGISRKLFNIMAETNPAEIGEFMPELADKMLSMMQSIWLWVFIVTFAAAWKWLPMVQKKWLMGCIGIPSGLGLVYLAYVFTTTDVGRTDHSVFARSYRCVAKYMKDRKVISELQSKKRPLPYPESLTSSRAAGRIVVVIGESASRDHLSIYGYPLPTTPYLDSISEGLYVFDDAVASSTSTAQNMPRLISFMTDEPQCGEWYEFPSLLQIFHHLGYQTNWLSNQEFSGKWSNLSSILSADADVVNYVGSIDSEDHYTVRFDDALLPAWRASLASGDSLQLTFLHLMGSHFQYAHRFPESRHHFSARDILKYKPRKWLDDRKAGIIADYDNSILYTDSILGVVIDDIRNSLIPSVIVYVSDHGENVYDDREYRGRDPHFVRVPFLVYVNEAYREKNPAVVEKLGAARSVPFSTSELPQMIMYLSGVDYQLYDSLRNPLSDGFIPRKRWVDEEEFLN